MAAGSSRIGSWRQCQNRFGRSKTSRSTRMGLTTLPESQRLSTNSPRPSSELPTLVELGADLLTTTPWQRRWALARPFLLVFCFAVMWQTQLWWLTPLVMFLLFVAVV